MKIDITKKDITKKDITKRDITKKLEIIDLHVEVEGKEIIN